MKHVEFGAGTLLYRKVVSGHRGVPIIGVAMVAANS